MRALTLVADRQLVTVPIEDVAAALKRMESRQVFGRIVIGF
jgi:hypothetical protein